MLADDFIGQMDEAGFTLLGDSYEPGAHPQSDILFLNLNWIDLQNQRKRAKA